MNQGDAVIKQEVTYVELPFLTEKELAKRLILNPLDSILMFNQERYATD